MSGIIILNKVKLYFPNTTSQEVLLTSTEEHPGNETPTYSLQAEKESIINNIEDAILDNEIELVAPIDNLLTARVLTTTIADMETSNILAVQEWEDR